ncbi:poly [ADP-ribose] polymerase tankyrase-1-like [Triticum urartu]|nr:poly [ADP-ribose] polymerase tankyrase-1-like [Triticum urartu]
MDVPTPACSPSSSAQPPPSSSGVDAAVDAGKDDERRRLLLDAAVDGNLDLLARMALELLPPAPSATGADAAAGVWSTCGRALHLAATNGRTDVCRYLVQDLGIPVDALSDERETPLLLAATFGHTATAAWLLERGASPRATDVDGETPLHWAAYNGDRDLAMLLLCKGADVGAANPRGTALHVPAMRGCPQVIRVLLRHGADPNKFASRVFTPLVSSLLGGSVECMKLLIEGGANVHAGGFSGATPLLLACSRRGNIGFVKCLLKAGADPNIPDELGRLPIEIAAVQGGKKLVQLLFPVTRCPPNMSGWSVAGIMSYVNSAAYKERVRKDSCKRKAELKLEGNKAYEIKDYDTAILMYNMALKFDDPNDIDASIYANKSLCWLRLGVGDEALSDAQACIRLWPDWGKGYYRQGEAFRFLQDYASAYAAFVKASELDPQNPKIANALRDLLERTKGALVSRRLEEGVQGRSQVLSGPCDQTVREQGSFVQALGRAQPLSSGQ